MVNVLFWNTCGHNVSRHLADLATEHDLHVVVLAECQVTEWTVLSALNGSGLGTFVSGYPNPGRNIFLLHRFQSNCVSMLRDTSLASFRAIAFPSGVDVTLASVHFPSKNYGDESDSAYYAREFRIDLEAVERTQRHRRTLVVGDFNMWPFENGMVLADALHAVMDRTIAKEQRRKIRDTYHRYFYNPMWGRLGDTSPGPAGSYYYRRSQPRDFFWHMFDQVILRAELIDHFLEDSLQILTSTSKSSLSTNKGRPSKSVSDHFPLIFSLDL